MNEFQVRVTETVSRTRLYTVEADTLEEAKRLAEQGWSVNEEDLDRGEVISREVVWDEEKQ